MDWNTMYDYGSEGQENISFSEENEEPLREEEFEGLTDETIAAIKTLDGNEFEQYIPSEIRKELEGGENPAISSKNEDPLSNGTFSVHNSLKLNPNPTKVILSGLWKSTIMVGRKKGTTPKRRCWVFWSPTSSISL